MRPRPFHPLLFAAFPRPLQISPVNSFRVLFNDYFAAGLPLLPDKVIAWEDGDHYYAFHDVTKASNDYRRRKARSERVRAATPAVRTASP